MLLKKETQFESTCGLMDGMDGVDSTRQIVGVAQRNSMKSTGNDRADHVPRATAGQAKRYADQMMVGIA